MYHKALVSIALVAVAVVTAGGAALALLGSEDSSSVAVTEQVLFDVGEAGTVIVTSDGSRLEVSEVTTASGWDHRIADSSGSSVNVVFVASGMGIDFHADLDDASVVGRIRILASPAPLPQAPLVDDVGTIATKADASGTTHDDPAIPAPVDRQSADSLQSESAQQKSPSTHGSGVEIGLEYGKVSGETPIIDPVLDASPTG